MIVLKESFDVQSILKVIVQGKKLVLTIVIKMDYALMENAYAFKTLSILLIAM